MRNKLSSMALAAIMVAGGALATGPAAAQDDAQFIPSMVYRTGPYAPNGIPFADGVADYINL